MVESSWSAEVPRCIMETEKDNGDGWIKEGSSEVSLQDRTFYLYDVFRDEFHVPCLHQLGEIIYDFVKEGSMLPT